MSFFKSIQNGETKCFAVDDKFYNSNNIKPHLDDGVHFYWNKTANAKIENSVDLRDIFNFYRIVELNDLASLFPTENVVKYHDIKNKMRSIFSSYNIANINIGDYQFYDLIPERFLRELCLSETRILKEGFDFLNEKPWLAEAVDFFRNFEAMDVLRRMNYEVNTTEGMKKVRLRWQANFRFNSLPGYLNLFNMRKEDRKKIIPHSSDHVIYYADFRQFEVRTFLMLHPHLKIDFENRELYAELAGRLGLDLASAKQQIIAYGYGQENKKLDAVLDRKAILENIEGDFYSWNGYPVIFRPKDQDKIKIHTLVQTIAQYKYVEKLNKIMDLLSETRSKFIYPLHDSVILSLHKDEFDLIDQFKNILEDDVHKIQQCLGPNLGELEDHE